MLFGGAEKNPAHMHSLVLGSGDTHAPEAGDRTRLLKGASSACQPIGQSDDGGPFGYSLGTRARIGDRHKKFIHKTPPKKIDPLFEARKTPFSDT